jgi:hypothetical protein
MPGAAASCEGRAPPTTHATVRFRESYAVRLEGSSWPILLKVRQVKPGGVGSHVRENTTESF